MKKLGNDKMDVDALLDEADRNKDGVIDYDGTRLDLALTIDYSREISFESCLILSWIIVPLPYL